MTYLDPFKAKRKGHTHRPHWYYTYVEFCVLCGHEHVDRERRYTKRPRKWSDRHSYSEHACPEHFI